MGNVHLGFGDDGANVIGNREMVVGLSRLCADHHFHFCTGETVEIGNAVMRRKFATCVASSKLCSGILIRRNSRLEFRGLQCNRFLYEKEVFSKQLHIFFQRFYFSPFLKLAAHMIVF